MTGIWTDPMRTLRSNLKERARGQKSWRKRDPTWHKRDPTWRKSDEIGEKVNFVGEKKYMLPAGPTSLGPFAATRRLGKPGGLGKGVPGLA